MTSPAATENQAGQVLAACARVMRPVIRLAVAFGVKHAQLEGLLRDLLLDEARRSWRQKGVEPNLSQLSVTTGLNRKAVTHHVRQPAAGLLHTERSAAAKTLTLWLQWMAGDPARRSLPLTAPDHDDVSFESMSRTATRGNVHHRTVLEELLRLGMISEHDRQVELRTDAFVPAKDMEGMLAFLGDNARDHLLAAVSNTLQSKAPMLERAVYAQGLTADDCERIHQRVREHWSALHRTLARDMSDAVDLAGGAGGARMRVGIYAYFEAPGNEGGGVDTASAMAYKGTE